MFLCQSCHWKSKCRAEMHLGIVREKCQACGCRLDCFDCPTTPAPARRATGPVAELIRMYRNTKQVRYKE